MIDTHAHLDHVDDLENILDIADKNKIEAIIAVSEDLESSKKNLEIKRTISHPNIFIGAGMHPSEADINELPDLIQFIKDNISELVAIGEVGLDFWYKWVKKDPKKKDEQIKVFKSLLELAKNNDLPAVIHSRGAWKECCDLAREIGIEKAVFHWYSGPIDILEDILSLGYYISATPSLDYSPQVIEAIKFYPIERTLIETDSPVFYKNRNDDNDKGFKSEPKDVFKTLDYYCKLKDLDKEKACNILNKNAINFFNLK